MEPNAVNHFLARWEELSKSTIMCISKKFVLLQALVFVACYIMQTSILPASDDSNDAFYSFELPEKHLVFWNEISDHLGHHEYDKVWEKLKIIDEFSENNDLSLLEFRNFVTVKLVCLPMISSDIRPIQYLDKVAKFTRKSKRWQKEKIVFEFFLSVFYASLHEYEKSKEAAEKALSEVAIYEKLGEWTTWYSFAQYRGLMLHLACTCAKLEKFDEATNICDSLLRDLENIMTSNQLELSEMSSESYQFFWAEIQAKRELFVKRTPFLMNCKCAMDVNVNEKLEFNGLYGLFHWTEQKRENSENPQHEKPHEIALVSWYLKLPTVQLDENRMTKSLENFERVDIEQQLSEPAKTLK